jgi:cobyrinic acid a,c-diamide synthase
MKFKASYGFNIPRIIIAGAYSGTGKTTVSTALMGILKNRGLHVQAFKVGPDYIDPSYHTLITGKPCRNLDAWMVSLDGLIEIFERGTRNADVAVIEGVMGLYDGFSGLDETGSTSQIAKLLRCPVILVIDVHDMARTAAPLVLGYKNFDQNVHLAGIILNRVGNSTHAKWCKEAIETVTGVPVVGALSINKAIAMPERHLGLIPTLERKMMDSFFSKLENFVQANVDVDKIIEIAKSAGELPEAANMIYPAKNYAKKVTIGVALDEAFNFYYQDNIDLLEAYGARVKFFSPIHDRSLPTDVDGLYLGGGFPEMLPKELEANKNMRRIVKESAESGMPIYAECGGLMYLTESITDF